MGHTTRTAKQINREANLCIVVAHERLGYSVTAKENLTNSANPQTCNVDL